MLIKKRKIVAHILRNVTAVCLWSRAKCKIQAKLSEMLNQSSAAAIQEKGMRIFPSTNKILISRHLFSVLNPLVKRVLKASKRVVISTPVAT